MKLSRLIPRLFSRPYGRPDESTNPTRRLIEPHVANPTPANFMVVLRESPGISLTRPSLDPIEQELQSALSRDNEQLTQEQAWYHFLGDVHIRFVSYQDGIANSISRANFLTYQLSVEDAIEVALNNIRQTHGKPSFRQWSQGIQIVQGQSADIDSSYLLDDLFWETLDAQHPDGLIVAVPKRGGLLFAPCTDTAAVELLTQNVTYLHSTSTEMRVSGALFSRRAGYWALHQEAADG